MADETQTDVSSFFLPDTGPWWKARVRPVWRLTVYGMYLVWMPAFVAEGARRHGFRWAWVFALVLWLWAAYWFRVAWKEERSVR